MTMMMMAKTLWVAVFRAPDLYTDEEKEAAFEGKQVPESSPTGTSSENGHSEESVLEKPSPAAEQLAAPRRLSRDSASKTLPEGMVLTISGLARSSKSMSKTTK